MRDDGLVDGVERGAIERVADLLAAALDGVAARVLAKDERRGHADVFRPHDFVRPPVLQHAVLVNPRFVRERVAPDDRLVGLHAFAGERGQQLARREDLGRLHARFVRQPIAADADRHHDFLERRVPRPFADPVDRALDLPGAAADRGERVRHSETEIVVAMRAERDLV